MHGLVPPHPGPLIAIAALHADLGITLAFGVIIAIPTVMIAGPLFGPLAARWVDVAGARTLFDDEPSTTAPAADEDDGDAHQSGRRPSTPGVHATLAAPCCCRGPDAGQGARRHRRRRPGQPGRRRCSTSSAPRWSRC